MILGQLLPVKIAHRTIAPRITAPWMIAPQIIAPRTIAPEDNCPLENCLLTIKLPPKIIAPTQVNSTQRILQVK